MPKRKCEECQKLTRGLGLALKQRDEARDMHKRQGEVVCAYAGEMSNLRRERDVATAELARINSPCASCKATCARANRAEGQLAILAMREIDRSLEAGERLSRIRATSALCHLRLPAPGETHPG